MSKFLPPINKDGHIITRVDFGHANDGYVVNMFAEGVKGTISHEIKPVDLDKAESWLLKHGYTVRKWPGGMRAWLGEAKPVRTAGQIRKLREKLYRYPRKDLEGTEIYLDLAYDL